MSAKWGQKVAEFRELLGPGILPIPAGADHVVGGSAESFELVRPPGADYIVVRAEAGNFRMKGGLMLPRTFAAIDVDTDEDTIETSTSPDLPHGLETGDGPLRLSVVSGALPTGTGIAVDSDVWAYKVDAHTLKLCLSHGDAVKKDADGNEVPVVIDITAAGSGSFLLGGDQGSGQAVGFEPAAAPTASTGTRGSGTIPLVSGETIAFSGRGLSLRSDGAYVLTWWAA